MGEIQLGSERELNKYINHYAVVTKASSKVMFKKNLNASKPSELVQQVYMLVAPVAQRYLVTL